MKPFFIGIAGGSGSGKTTIAKELKKHLGEKASVFHVDNYQRFGEKLPQLKGIKNWDHPKSMNWDRLLRDLILLKRNETITIKSRNQKSLWEMKEKNFSPTRIVIIEGYLLFYKSSVRKLLNFLIFLKAGDEIRVERRTKSKKTKYIKKVLLPMHYKYVEPTKRFADLIIDTEKNSINQCCKKILKKLPYP